MSEQLINQTYTIDIGVNIADVYERVFSPLGANASLHHIPHFEDLYDVYREFYIQKNVIDEEQQIFVQNRPMPIYTRVDGVSKDVFFNALIENNLAFILDSQIYNNPIVEVW